MTHTDPQVLVFHIHRDYLVTQSNLLRSLLTATSPFRPTFPHSPNTPQARSFPTPTPTPTLRMPKEKTMRGSRVLPQREGEPVSVYMPIPDPASFGLVLHWLYWYVVSSLSRKRPRKDAKGQYTDDQGRYTDYRTCPLTRTSDLARGSQEYRILSP